MCSRLSQTQRQPIKVGGQVKVYRDRHEYTAKWTGFARSETLDKWAVWEPVEIPVTGFAEKNHSTGVHTWKHEPVTICGIMFKGNVRVVTEEADSKALAFFGHSRVPKEA